MRFPRRRPPATIGDVTVPEDWIRLRAYDSWGRPYPAIRGESRHSKAFERLIGPVKTQLAERGYFHPVRVELIREPDNPVDVNACRAVMWVGPTADRSAWIGYLAREIAAVLAPAADAAGVTSWHVAGVVMGGSATAPNFGCHLWLARRLTPGPIWSQPEDAW